MRKGERKRLLLELIHKEEWLDAGKVLGKIKGLGLEAPTLKAIEMALLRYYRQGLLTRRWAGGRYLYKITDRGVQRLKALTALVEGGLRDD